MPNRTAVSLAECRRLGIRPAWPEAVAVVLEAAEQVSRSGDSSVTPDAAHVVVGCDGLAVVPGTPIPPHPVQQIARLLADLLHDEPAPSELRELIAQNDQIPPACAWIEEFTTALAFFERPQRREMIAQFGARAASEHAARTRGGSGVTDGGEQSAGTGPGAAGVLLRIQRLFGRRGR